MSLSVNCDKMLTTMARKKKRSSSKPNPRSESYKSLSLNPEAKRGIYVIFFFAAAALIFLSYFHIAGSVGIWINSALSSFFGLDRYLVPIVLIILGATLAYPDRGRLSTWNYLGLLFFFLSFNALLNLFIVNRPEPFTTDLTLRAATSGNS